MENNASSGYTLLSPSSGDTAGGVTAHENTNHGMAAAFDHYDHIGGGMRTTEVFMQNQAIKSVVKRMYRTIVSEIDPASTIMDWFIEKGVFTIDSKHKMLAHHSPQDRCRAVLDSLLHTSHFTAFIVFRDALRDHHSWISGKIDEEVENALKVPQRISFLESEMRQIQIQETGQFHFHSPSVLNPSANHFTSGVPSLLAARSKSVEPNISSTASANILGRAAQNSVLYPSPWNGLQTQFLQQQQEIQSTQQRQQQLVPQDPQHQMHEYLLRQIMAKDQLLQQKDEEIRRLTSRLEIIKRISEGGAGWEMLKSSEREEDLEEKLKRSEEREKALVAQLEFSNRNRILEQPTSMGAIQRRKISGARYRESQVGSYSESESSHNTDDELGGPSYESPVHSRTPPLPSIKLPPRDKYTAIQSNPLPPAVNIEKDGSARFWTNNVNRLPVLPAAESNPAVEQTDSDCDIYEDIAEHTSPPPLPVRNQPETTISAGRLKPSRPAVPPKPQKKTNKSEESPYADVDISPESVTRSLKELEITPDSIELLYQVFFAQFVEIWKGKQKSTDRLVAVKCLISPTEKRIAQFLNEAEILARLQHPNIIELLGVASVSSTHYIVLEYLPMEDLLTHLQLDKGSDISLQKIVSIAKQIADGMNYLDKNNYVHRILNATAILMNENQSVKITQFRLGAYVGNSNGVFFDKVYSLKGVHHKWIKKRWTDPEALSTYKWSSRSDVWSFGVLLYEMLTYGGFPYMGFKESEILTSIQSGYRLPRPPCHKDAVTKLAYEVIYSEVMLRCWDQIPANRPSFSDISDFFENFSIDRPHRNMSIDTDEFLTSVDSVSTCTSGLEVSATGLNRVPSYIRDRYSAVPKLLGVIAPITGAEVAAVHGVAVLGRYIYIVRCGLHHIEVYGEKDHIERSKHRILVQGTTVEVMKTHSKTVAMALRLIKKKKSLPTLNAGPVKGLSDIVASTKDSCLFFIDSSESRIHRLDPTNLATGHKCWGVEGDPTTLSLDREGHIYVCCPGIPAVLKYAPDGEFKARVDMNLEIGPWHAVPSDGGRLFYCHEMKYSNEGFVSMCDKNGEEEINKFMRYTSNGPQYLSVDPYSSQIIVADYGDGRIMLLSPTGKETRNLVVYGLTGQPIRLCLCRNSHKLYVGMQDGRVLVYEVIEDPESKAEEETYISIRGRLIKRGNLT